MKYFLLFVTAVSFLTETYAQDKPLASATKDSVFRKRDTTVHPQDSVYHAGFTAAGSINKSPDDITYLFNNDLKLALKRKSLSLSFENSWIYGVDNHKTTNNDYSSVLQLNLYKTIPHFFYWGLANYNTSYSLKINNQLLAGGGVAYSIFDRKHVYFNLSDGLVYDQSDLVLPDSSRLVYHTVRNSLRLSFRFEIHNLLVFDGSDFIQNSFRQGTDYNIRSVTNLSLKLNKWLNLTSSLNYNVQKRTQSTNLVFTYGIKVDKYF